MSLSRVLARKVPLTWAIDSTKDILVTDRLERGGDCTLFAVLLVVRTFLIAQKQIKYPIVAFCQLF
uniref:Uncharacterized protein n=1 Tax=Lepeophtheirus salmonis TaxID=72036 RepID=A0A0K2UAR9_LEPSM